MRSHPRSPHNPSRSSKAPQHSQASAPRRSPHPTGRSRPFLPPSSLAMPQSVRLRYHPPPEPTTTSHTTPRGRPVTLQPRSPSSRQRRHLLPHPSGTMITSALTSASGRVRHDGRAAPAAGVDGSGEGVRMRSEELRWARRQCEGSGVWGDEERQGRAGTEPSSCLNKLIALNQSHSREQIAAVYPFVRFPP